MQMLARMDEVKRICSLARTTEEIQAYAIEFIKQCYTHAEENDRQPFLECLVTLLSQYAPEKLNQVFLYTFFHCIHHLNLGNYN
jgi:hypothetical protein